jgi:phosphate transport system protein
MTEKPTHKPSEKPPHTHREFEQELGQVRQNLLNMSRQVEHMIAESVRAVHEADLDLARRTIEEDHKVNRLELDTDDLCLLIVAKRQPVGSDLRLVTTATKMVTDLERIGDLAVNIAERALALNGQKPGKFGPVLFSMAELTREQLREATEAFVARDADRARKVLDRDDDVDRLYSDIVRNVQKAIQGDLDFLEGGVHILAVAKFLERIGDHVVNLAEPVIFLVRGQDVRHSRPTGGKLHG